MSISKPNPTIKLGALANILSATCLEVRAQSSVVYSRAPQLAECVLVKN